MPKILVQDIMNTDILTMKPDKKLLEAIRLMHKKNSDYVLVSKDGFMDGIITERDVVSKLMADDPSSINSILLSDIMTSPVISIDMNKDVKDAWEFISETKIKHLIITDGEKAVGIVTLFDILAVAPDIFECNLEQENPEGGFCEFCGNYFPTLNEVGGKYVCDSCKDQLLEE